MVVVMNVVGMRWMMLSLTMPCMPMPCMPMSPASWDCMLGPMPPVPMEASISKGFPPPRAGEGVSGG